MGCVMQVGEQGRERGPHASLAAGFPESVPATTNRPPVRVLPAGTALRRQGVMAGAYDVVIAAGIESIDPHPHGLLRSSATWVSPSVPR